ncbi:integral membrane sensor signal transduction histidine kinase [Cellulomonas flavigena DSM 20109]|uniref:histidine kinase n=1 Tax=Cellulomonas flavigena (strain ATCC 482 / DSM 20109 / BCRC 11376 / JCM 18109 / NBRC 3775 / NCIMB 8073 / NRS 134) TaxID=446466 RepID=D5UJT9_CELFN|nr:histidine kinase [Cellulomonas flavigena]ADG75727.1 integral membrane sensor signal transduction histidine kinase [Cellulomonas flavigena DSM 20109]
MTSAESDDVQGPAAPREVGVPHPGARGWESGPVIRRAAVVRVPSTRDEPPLTEAQVRGASHVARVLADHPWITDVAVVAGVALTGVVGAVALWETAVGAVALGLYPPGSPVADSVTTVSLVGTLVAAVLLLGRRARPLAVTALLTLVALASLVTAGVLGVLGVALACALCSVAVVRSTVVTWATFGVVLTALTAALWHWQDLGVLEFFLWSGGAPAPPDPSGWNPPHLDEPLFSAGRRMGSVLLLLALLLLGLAVGFAARARRLHAADLVERYRALARERDDSAALARAAERAHIAREMHDVVAHSVSVMIALADGADAAFERAPDRSRDAVRQVARTGRAALADMQRVLGALGPVGGEDARLSEPTEVDLVTVVERFGVAGVPVTASGLDTPLPDDTSVRLAVTRILGEALTNVLRHAPGATSVEVAVRRTPTAVEVDVADSGGTRPGDGGGTGRGVVGMRERAALLGGHVEAGPRPEGGWRVRAVLPWREDEDEPARRAAQDGGDT